MKIRRDAKTLKQKAINSLRIGLEAFNGFTEGGRVTTVLLHLQHACEMMLKAALVQRKIGVFDRGKGQAFGFDKCLKLASEHCHFSSEQAGVFRTVDSLRDAEQHWIIVVPEDTLYLHARALVTAFDEMLEKEFIERLADYLPSRVLPISTMPETDFQLMIDRECHLIRELLSPGRRARDDAQGRIRTLLAMEGHTVEGLQISDRDVARVEKALKNNEPWDKIFPQLTSITTEFVGTAVDLKVHFTKQQGIPIKYISADDPTNAAAIRHVNLQDRFRYSRSELATHLSLTAAQCKILREKLKIDSDSELCHTFEFSSQRHPQFSDQAIIKMRNALKSDDLRAEIMKPRKRVKTRAH